MKRLIKRHNEYDMTLLSDALSCIAANCEDAFLMSGAVPGKDYTMTDLMQLAMDYLKTTKFGNSIHTNTTICGQQ